MLDAGKILLAQRGSLLLVGRARHGNHALAAACRRHDREHKRRLPRTRRRVVHAADCERCRLSEPVVRDAARLGEREQCDARAAEHSEQDDVKAHEVPSCDCGCDGYGRRLRLASA